MARQFKILKFSAKKLQKKISERERKQKNKKKTI